MINETELEQRLKNNIKRKKENIQEDTQEVHKMTKELMDINIKKGKAIIDRMENMEKTKAEILVEQVNEAINGKRPLDPNDKYEMVNHPKHYNNYDVEVVDMMEKIWGTKATMDWCKMTAYKYRMRMGTKPNENDSPEAMKNKLLEDFSKEQWYLKKAEELKLKLLAKKIDMNQY